MRLYLNTLKEIETEFGEFDVSQVFGGDNDVYLRFGYWNSVDGAKLQQIIGNSVKVVEDVFEDDDCGYLYSYKLKRTL
jgi:hypothetical protein